MKKRNKNAFSIVEVLIAISIFAISTTILVCSISNGLLCRQNMSRHNYESINYQFIFHIINNSESIDQAEQISSLSLPTGKIIPISVKISETDTDNLFHLSVASKSKQTICDMFVANKNWSKK